ncbi:MAG TPA: anti-sigma factor [Microthrixaceae bacterium]|nr:anti-sigma factor [Microthrixaceae bacterium]
MPTHDLPDGVPSDDGFDGEFRREADLLRSLAQEPIEFVDAPAGLWDRISAIAEQDADRVLVGPDVLEHHRGRRRPAVLVTVAAAVAALVVGAGIVVANRQDAGPTEIAAAELAPYGGADVGSAGGTVEVLSEDDQLRLQVDMHDLPAPAPGTFYELWLINPTSGTPVSVATMRDGSSDVTTSIDLPAGTDPATYDVVDVSVQEDGAGPEHSGNSVLRGALSA